MNEPAIRFQVPPVRERRLRTELDEARAVIRELLEHAEDDRMDYEESCAAVIAHARAYLERHA